MNYNSVFDKYIFSPSKAEQNGFNKTDNSYTIKKPLSENGFYAVFEISGENIEVNVYEEPDGELYLPFNTSADGGFVGQIRANVEDILDDILSTSFELADVKAVLLEYVSKKYGTVPEAPWGYLKEYHTLNTAKKHKWYGLFMLIPYSYLGVEREGKINVLNLKVLPDDIPKLIDNIHYFPSYHMNKKYWISILLDREADIPRIEKLLDDSYAIVEGNKK